MKCRHCSNSFQDMKSLQIHNFLEHPTSESPPPRKPSPVSVSVSDSPQPQSQSQPLSQSHPQPQPQAALPQTPGSQSLLNQSQAAPAQLQGLLLQPQAPPLVLSQGQGHRCHMCHASLPSQAAFQQHLQTHMHFRPHICSHSQCDAGFTSRAALEAHSRLHL